MEPALDLPRRPCARLVDPRSAIPPGTVAVGEIGLLGELRGVTGLERRLREAARLGFERAIVPARSRRRLARRRRHRPGAGRERSSGDRARAQRRSGSSWRVGPGDARLTLPGPNGRGLAGRVPRRSLIRFIRVFGAALGGRDRPRSRHDGSGAVPWRLLRCVARRLGRGMARHGLRDPAVPHGGPGRVVDSRGRGPLHGRVHRCGRRIPHRAADGLAAGIPAVGSAGAVGFAAAVGRLDLPRPRDARPHGRQARGSPDRR